MQYSNTPATERGWGFWLGWAIAFLGFPLGGLAAWALMAAWTIWGVPALPH